MVRARVDRLLVVAHVVPPGVVRLQGRREPLEYRQSRAWDGWRGGDERGDRGAGGEGGPGEQQQHPVQVRRCQDVVDLAGAQPEHAALAERLRTEVHGVPPGVARDQPGDVEERADRLAAHRRFTALRAALLAGERVASLTLVDTAADAFPGPALAQIAQIRDGFAAGAVSETGSAVLELLLGSRAAEAHWLPRLGRQPAERLSRAVGALMGADSVARRLGEITAPALVVHGSADLPIPPEAGVALAAALPAAEPVEVLDGVAHTPPVTHAAGFSALLQRFSKAHR